MKPIEEVPQKGQQKKAVLMAEAPNNPQVKQILDDITEAKRQEREELADAQLAQICTLCASFRDFFSHVFSFLRIKN